MKTEELRAKVQQAIARKFQESVEREERASGVLTHSLLLELVEYNQHTGIFTWKRGKNKGKVAGWSNDDGYVYLTLKGTKYGAHIIAWFYVHGKWPVHEIDHKDRIRHNNWIANLRDVTHQVNSTNKEHSPFCSSA